MPLCEIKIFATGTNQQQQQQKLWRQVQHGLRVWWTPFSLYPRIQKITIAGDANEDGNVAFEDFLALSQNYGQPGGWTEGDFNLDEQVGFPDFLILSKNYGAMANPSEEVMNQVPEPSSLLMLTVGMFLLLARFRRPTVN